MNPIKIIGLSIILFFTKSSYSQVVHSITLNPTKDVGVSSFFPNSSFGDTSNLPIGKFGVYDGNGNLVTYDTRRAFLQFDLSSIPANAIITNAIFKVYQYASANIVTNANLAIPRVLNPWEESGVNAVTWNSQPNVAPGTPLNFNGNSTGWIQVQARSTVQEIVNGTITNNGWMLRLSTSEPTAAINNRFTRSKEHVNQAQRPQLVVDYYIPMVVTDAIINHQDGATSNGSIEPVLDKGPGGTITYKWYNSSGSLLKTSTTSPNLTNIPAGWYGLEVTSNKYASLPFYTSFIVGQKCSDHSFVFEPGSKFMDDIVISSLNKGTSYGGTTPIMIEDATDERYMLMKFHLWIPEDLEIVQADFTIKMGSQSLNTNPNNSLYLYKIASGAWIEEFVTYNSYSAFSEPNPNEAQNSLLTIPPTASGGNAPFHTLDAINLFNSMKDDNQNNYGFISRFVHVNNTLKRAQYYSSRGGDPTLRPRVSFIVRVKESITSAWDSDTDKGKIFVDITGICDKVGPYHYFISKDSIPDLIQTYTFLSDSLNIPLDSLKFFQGKEASSTFTFEHLTADNYFVSVFDSRGIRLIYKMLSVYPKINSLSNSNGIVILNDSRIKASANNSSAILDLNLFDGDDGEIIFKLDNRYYNNGIQYFGLCNATEDTASLSVLAYGFRLNNDSLYTIISEYSDSINFTKSTIFSGITTSLNSELKISVKDGSLNLFHNNKLIGVKRLPKAYNFKSEVGLNENSEAKVMIKGLFSKKTHRITVKIPQYATCETNTGTFSFRITFFKKESVNYLVTSLNDPAVNLSGTISWQNPTTQQFSGYPVGIYLITITSAVTGLELLTYYVYLGYQVDWAYYENYDLTPNDYSLERNNNNLFSGVAGLGRSSNVLPYDEQGWVKFRPKVSYEYNPTFYYSTLRFSSMNPNLNSLPIFNNEYGLVNFVRFNLSPNPIVSALLFRDGIGQVSFDLFNQDVNFSKNFVLNFDAAGGTELVNLTSNNDFGSLSLNGTRPLDATRLRFNTFKEQDGFYDVISSFGCPENKIYAKLERKVTGAKYIAYLGKVQFYYDQEYDNSAPFLNYKVYAENNAIIPILSGVTQPLQLKYGDNRFKLDVQLPNGEYILEVTNDKLEKFFLRFQII